MKTTIMAFWIATLGLPAGAAQIPSAGRHDARVSYVTYSRDDVTVIPVQRGTVTRIILADDEKIVRDGSATGFAADCSKQELEWCIRADVGASQVLVKPKDGATNNNLELKTDKRDYSFSFQVLPDARKAASGQEPQSLGRKPMYRVIFRYRVVPPAPALLTAQSGNADPSDSVVLAGRLARSRPQARNWNYTMQVMKGAEDVAPSLAFDDGRFTYFQFPANREVPTIFYVSPAGEEARVNFHMDETDKSLLVVERLGRRFILRLGHATVGIWNEDFDPDGVAPRDGTTIEGVVRELRKGGQP